MGNELADERTPTESEICSPLDQKYNFAKVIANKAFAAGEQAQQEASKQGIDTILEANKSWREGFEKLTAENLQLKEALAEAEKRGAFKAIVDIRAWGNQYCQDEEHRISGCQMHKRHHCHDCFESYCESKLKSLEE